MNLYLAMQILLIILGFLIFEPYSYWQLFGHVAHFDAATFISALITATFVVMFILRIVDLLLDHPAPAIALGSYTSTGRRA